MQDSDDRPDGHPLDFYLRTIRKLRVLSREEEQALGKRKDEGETEAEKQLAKDQLTERNLRLVVSIALRYTKDPELLGVLIQEGSIGLMGAVETFDYQRNLIPLLSHWDKARASLHQGDEARTATLQQRQVEAFQPAIQETIGHIRLEKQA